jgi:hypothetical protein
LQSSHVLGERFRLIFVANAWWLRDKRDCGDELVSAVPVAVVAHRYRRALIGEAVCNRRTDATGPAADNGTHPANLSVAGGFEGRGSDSNTLVMINALFVVGDLGQF